MDRVGGDTVIRGGRGTGVKGAGNGGKGGGEWGERGRGTGEEGAGVGKFWGRGLYQNLLYFTDFTLFLLLQCNNWVLEVSNRHIKINSGMFTMNLALISLHRLGVFRQPWFTLISFTSDFGLSLFDYFPLIPKVHKKALSVAIHIFRNNYPSAVDNHFICSLLDKDFCAVQNTKTTKQP